LNKSQDSIGKIINAGTATIDATNDLTGGVPIATDMINKNVANIFQAGSDIFQGVKKELTKAEKEDIENKRIEAMKPKMFKNKDFRQWFINKQLKFFQE
jgi:hypothetical protein